MLPVPPMGHKTTRAILKNANRADKLRMPTNRGECYEFKVSNIIALACQLTNPL